MHDCPGSFNGRTTDFGAVNRGSSPLPGARDPVETPVGPTRWDSPGTVAGMRMRDRLVAGLLIGAIGLAFADASVVALALPDLYGEFDTSIVGVSWVLTTYALAVALTAVPVAVLHGRVRPLALVV